MNSLAQKLKVFSDKDVLNRNGRIKGQLYQIKGETLLMIDSWVKDALMNTKKSEMICSEENFQQSMDKFKRASINIVNVFFPVLMQDNYISLIYQQEIINKARHFCSSIEKNWLTLYRELTKPKEQLQVIRKKIRKQEVRRSKNCKISVDSTFVLQKWLLENFSNPYPSHSKKIEMARQSKLSICQVNNWFINVRERVVKRFYKKQTLKILNQGEALQQV